MQKIFLKEGFVLPMGARPNLFLVGAMKSGSSSLTHYLHAHPQIFMTMRPKEPSYFVMRQQLKEVYPQMEKLGLWESEEKYLSLFKDVIDECVVGEASQNYARLRKVLGVAERIYSFNQDAKILYIMRDPIERVISHYWYMVQNFGESREILKAVMSEPDYTDTSHYAMQLKPYIDLFGKKNVMAITSESLFANPASVMSDVYTWLGVDAGFQPENVSIRENVTPGKVPQSRGFGLLYRFKYSRIWSIVGPSMPASARAFGNWLSMKKINKKDVNADKVADYLRPIQLEQTVELSSMLGREFPEWDTLY